MLAQRLCCGPLTAPLLTQIQGKSVFDWVSDAEMPEVVPFDESGGLCRPCGPYYLSPTDATTKPASGATMGLAIATAAATNRYFFVEHRSSSTSGNAALITWSDVRSGGRTGIWENSVLVDCTPDTTSFFDAGCVPGMSIVLDAGTSVENSYEITLTVNEVR